jgi:IS5 family transposase
MATCMFEEAERENYDSCFQELLKEVRGDAGYQGQTETIHAAAPAAQDMTSRRAKYKGGVDEVERRKNRTKARVRSKVE